MEISKRNSHFTTVAGKPGTPITAMLFSLALLLVTACSTTGPGMAPAPDGTAGAEASFSRGNYEQAAKTWQQEALDADPGKASKLRVRAADAWLLAGNTGNAENALRWVDRKELASQDKSRLDMVLVISHCGTTDRMKPSSY